MNLEQEMITNVIKEIINIDINDGVEFIFTNIEIIRKSITMITFVYRL